MFNDEQLELVLCKVSLNFEIHVLQDFSLAILHTMLAVLFFNSFFTRFGRFLSAIHYDAFFKLPHILSKELNDKKTRNYCPVKRMDWSNKEAGKFIHRRTNSKIKIKFAIKKKVLNYLKTTFKKKTLRLKNVPKPILIFL